MAIREIVYTIGTGENGATISPASVQKGGLQGDHRVTALRFIIQEGLYNTLLRYKENGGELLYHFDVVDGAGGVCYYGATVLEDREIGFILEKAVTQYGGIVKVTLVITVAMGEGAEIESFNFPAELKFTFSPHTHTDKHEKYQSMATMSQNAKQSAESAAKSAAEAKAALEETESAKVALNGGATYIFDGGDASGEVDVWFVVDKDMKDFSQNPVSNAAIKKYVDSKYPVGSIWIGGKKDGEPINPSTILGGEWSLIDKQFKTARYYVTEKVTLLDYFVGDDERVGTNIDISMLHLEYNDHSIVCTINSKCAAPLDDTTWFLLYFKIPTLENDIGNPWGVIYTKTAGGAYENIIYPQLVEGRSDSGKAICLLKAYSLDGEIVVVCNEVIPSEKLDINNDLNFSFTMNFLPKNMRNSFCDRFYWKRIG